MRKQYKNVLQFVIVVIVLSVSVFALKTIMANKQSLQKKKPIVSAPLVRFIKVNAIPYKMIIQGHGTVFPVETIKIIPLVSGKIIYVSEHLVNGGTFNKGDILLRIDPVDYKLVVKLAEAKIKKSQSDLYMAEEEAAAAREEWYELYPDKTDTNQTLNQPPPLVMKEPQLAAARAALEGNLADLEKAKLQLQRCTIRAPFKGRVSNENTGVGQYASFGQSLATIYSIEAAEIILPLESEDLFWFHVPGFTKDDIKSQTVTIRASVAGQLKSWSGKVVRAEGQVDSRTRMVNVVILVEKPYDDKPPLASGLFVSADIEGRIIDNAVIIPRSALRQDNIVWLIDNENRLFFKKVKVVRINNDNVITRGSLAPGDMVVISPLKIVTDGMLVRKTNINKGGNS
jgi:RND family efflux transporter MFP subunit